MLGAESKCRRKKQGYLWLLQLVMAAKTVWYWKTRQSDCLNGPPLPDNLQKIGLVLGIPSDQLSIDHIKSSVTSARKALKKAQAHASELRDDYLEEMA
eukprot:12878934-Ditylum_brightwellii.AAC.1